MPAPCLDIGELHNSLLNPAPLLTVFLLPNEKREMQYIVLCISKKLFEISENTSGGSLALVNVRCKALDEAFELCWLTYGKV